MLIIPELVKDRDCEFLGGFNPTTRQVNDITGHWHYGVIHRCLEVVLPARMMHIVSSIALTCLQPNGLPKPWAHSLVNGVDSYWPQQQSSHLIGRQRLMFPLKKPQQVPPDTRAALKDLVQSAPDLLTMAGLHVDIASQFEVSDVSLMVMYIYFIIIISTANYYVQFVADKLGSLSAIAFYDVGTRGLTSV